MKCTSSWNLARNLKKKNGNITEDSVWSTQDKHKFQNVVLVWFHIPNNLHYMFIYSFSKLYIYNIFGVFVIAIIDDKNGL